MLKQGLYEQVVNTEIKDELRQLPEDSKHVEKIDTAESSSVLTQYLSEVVHKGLDRIAGDDISAQLNLVNKIVDLISQETAQDDLRDFTVDDEGEQLFALLSRDDPMMRIGRKKAKDLPRPRNIDCSKQLIYRSSSRAADVFRAEERNRLRRPH